jgi:SAM-dependent methyltransferase
VHPKSILALPRAYRLMDRLVAGNFRKHYVGQFVRPTPGDRVLDIGCGPGDFLEYLPEVDYLGLDVSLPYIVAARARHGQRGTFVCMPVKDMILDEPGTFDIALANGVAHHLDDDEALKLYRLAETALRPGGRLVTYDGCFERGQSPAARYILSHDRGKHVRTADGYFALASQVFPTVKVSVFHNLLRIPYTHAFLECST